MRLYSIILFIYAWCILLFVGKTNQDYVVIVSAVLAGSISVILVCAAVVVSLVIKYRGNLRHMKADTKFYSNYVFIQVYGAESKNCMLYF